MESNEKLKEQVATACRILGTQGFEEYGFAGHVSARIPGDSNKFMVLGHAHYHELGRGIGDATPQDIITMDVDGNKVEGRWPPVGEIVIHTSIYKARPDVNAIVHCHPPAIVAFSVTTGEIQPINVNYIIPFKKGISRFDLGARVILTPKDGEALVRALGRGCVAIQRGHGVVAVGESIQEAVMNTIFVEKSLRLQIAASNFGKLTPFDTLEADYGAKTVKEGETVKEVIDEFYNYYASRVAAAEIKK